MAGINTKTKAAPIFTHEGGTSARIHPIQELTRSVMSCLLWEDGFYESGQTIADRIMALVPKVPPQNVQAIAFEAREQMKLRHVPLLLCYAMTLHDSHKGYVADTLARVIQRPDEITEFVAMYFKLGGKTLSAQSKRGLARAFQKFDEYALAKYNREKDWRLRDVLFLCHSKPADVPVDGAKWNKSARAAYDTSRGFSRSFTAGEILYGKLVNGELDTPDTWEVELSAGQDKAATFSRLMSENKIGDLAFLRNLRNMEQAGVPRDMIVSYGNSRRWGRVLPFRFIAAARFVPQLEPALEGWMFKCLDGAKKLAGKTRLLVDVSGSMRDCMSGKSDLSRIDAAKALAMLLREVCDEVEIYRFNYDASIVPPRRGFALCDAIGNASGGTAVGASYRSISTARAARDIVITDEQSTDKPPRPNADHGYFINVASNRNGIGYGDWMHIDGFSEAVVDYIVNHEEVGLK